MKIKIEEYNEGAPAIFERYTSSEKVPGYDDLTQLWTLKNHLSDLMIVTIDGKRYTVGRRADPGLITDKASTPGENSDWYPARRAYLWHDTDFSLHNWAPFEVNGDKGFRATNLMFLADIKWHIKRARKDKKISGWKAFWWRAKAVRWYIATNSIAGQGIYVNMPPNRGNHANHSTTVITPKSL